MLDSLELRLLSKTAFTAQAVGYFGAGLGALRGFEGGLPRVRHLPYRSQIGRDLVRVWRASGRGVCGVVVEELVVFVEVSVGEVVGDGVVGVVVVVVVVLVVVGVVVVIVLARALGLP